MAPRAKQNIDVVATSSTYVHKVFALQAESTVLLQFNTKLIMQRFKQKLKPIQDRRLVMLWAPMLKINSQYTEFQDVIAVFCSKAVDSDTKIFSKNEIDPLIQQK